MFNMLVTVISWLLTAIFTIGFAGYCAGILTVAFFTYLGPLPLIKFRQAWAKIKNLGGF